MRKLFLALLLFAVPAFAQNAGTCTGEATVGLTSTAVIPAEDVTGGRHFMFLQNVGTNPMYCAIGKTATTTNGMYIPSLGSIYFTSVEGVNGVFYLVPQAVVNCIATGGSTSAVYCDY